MAFVTVSSIFSWCDAATCAAASSKARGTGRVRTTFAECAQLRVPDAVGGVDRRQATAERGAVTAPRESRARLPLSKLTGCFGESAVVKATPATSATFGSRQTLEQRNHEGERFGPRG